MWAYTLIVKAHRRAGHLLGYREAALCLWPNMHMVAAIVWVALTKTSGNSHIRLPPVTCQMFCSWINTGRVPLQAAFCRLLSPKWQEQLQSLERFFSLAEPLSPATLEATAENLCVACRLRIVPKVVDSLDNEEDSIDENDDDDETDSMDPDHLVTFENEDKLSRTRRKWQSSQRSKKRQKALYVNAAHEPAVLTKIFRVQSVRFWSVADVPRLLAQLVVDAGLDQGVLDRALVMADFALEPSRRNHNPMRLRLKDPREEWQRLIDIKTSKMNSTLPLRKRIHHQSKKCLDLDELPQLVNPEALTTVEELLALIAISCQLDPQWRNWQYTLTASAPTSSKQEQLNPLPRAPWNESQFRFLTQGPALEAYLRFCEECIFPGGDDNVNTGKHCTMLPDKYFAAVGGPSLEQELELYSNQGRNSPSTVKMTDIGKGDVATLDSVRPCKVLAGAHLQRETDFSNVTFCKRAPVVNHGSLSISRPETKCDGPMTIPMFDFRRADRAASLRIPIGCQDADQARLLEALAMAGGADPERLRQTMIRILQQKHV